MSRSAKLDLSLEDLIEPKSVRRKKAGVPSTRVERAKPSGRRHNVDVTMEPPRGQGEARRVITTDGTSRPRLRTNRNLDVAVRGAIGKPAPLAVYQPQIPQPFPMPRPAMPPAQQFVAIPKGYMLAPKPKLSSADAVLVSAEVVKKEDGDVAIIFKGTEVILVKAQTGEIILNSGGFKTFSTRTILNEALQPVGMRVETKNQSQDSTDWVVSDGRSYLSSFSDGMVIKQAGTSASKAQMLARGSVILQFMSQRKKSAEKHARYLSSKTRNNQPRRSGGSIGGGDAQMS